MNAPAAIGPLACPPGVEPRVWRKAVHQRIERHLELVSALLAILDTVDGDADLEPAGDEEDFAYPEAHLGRVLMGTDASPHEGDEDDGTAELTLGAPEIPPEHLINGGRKRGWLVRAGSQASWAKGYNHPRGEGCEIDDDFEAVNENGGDIVDEPHDESEGFGWPSYGECGATTTIRGGGSGDL